MILMRPLPTTTDEGALLAAIAAAPMDEAPRLVYADWLQERGDEARSDYLRTVVALMHSPEEPAAVERCIALANGLDAGWRQAGGGRFEVVLEGNAGMQLLAFLLRFAAGLAFREHVGPWRAGEPVRMKSALTREDAEAFLQTFGGPILRRIEPDDPTIRLYVRPMGHETPPTLFAPTDPP